ncbi:MAG TPA: hypothetical protein VMI31_19200 [Fimbriimonadaceae bacterium]|nr:hypothetical protein [Fimbriimonadaceae bacterium]
MQYESPDSRQNPRWAILGPIVVAAAFAVFQAAKYLGSMTGGGSDLPTIDNVDPGVEGSASSPRSAEPQTISVRPGSLDAAIIWVRLPQRDLRRPTSFFITDEHDAPVAAREMMLTNRYEAISILRGYPVRPTRLTLHLTGWTGRLPVNLKVPVESLPDPSPRLLPKPKPSSAAVVTVRGEGDFHVDLARKNPRAQFAVVEVLQTTYFPSDVAVQIPLAKNGRFAGYLQVQGGQMADAARLRVYEGYEETATGTVDFRSAQLTAASARTPRRFPQPETVAGPLGVLFQLQYFQPTVARSNGVNRGRLFCGIRECYRPTDLEKLIGVKPAVLIPTSPTKEALGLEWLSCSRSIDTDGNVLAPAPASMEAKPGPGDLVVRATVYRDLALDDWSVVVPVTPVRR